MSSHRKRAAASYLAPPMFHGVGGLKVFRDEIFGHLRPVFQADHQHYKAHGYYDFPTRAWRVRLMGFLLTQLFRIPRARREFEKQLKHGMIRGLAAVVEQAGPAELPAPRTVHLPSSPVTVRP